MISFNDIKEGEMIDIIDRRTDLSFRVSDELTRFSQDIPGVDFSQEREVPPTSLILTREGLAEILLHAAPDARGRFMQFIVFIYAFGGRVFYRKLETGFYEAKVVWEKG